LAITLTAKHLTENNKKSIIHSGSKTPCMKYQKSGIAKCQQLHWWQSTLVKISNIRH
jgi:hypothetical protein